jgi:hypothetical protein
MDRHALLPSVGSEDKPSLGNENDHGLSTEDYGQWKADILKRNGINEPNPRPDQPRNLEECGENCISMRASDMYQDMLAIHDLAVLPHGHRDRSVLMR